MPVEKERLIRMDWTWLGGGKDIVHAIFRREQTPYKVTAVDYVTGCGLVLSVDHIPQRSRLKDRVPTCLRCSVAGINPTVVPGE